MPRILGVDVPNDKRIDIALTYLFGVGTTTANKVVQELGLRPEVRAKDLTDEEVAKIAGRPADEPEVALADDDPLAITFTGGTTGKAKAVLVSHRARFANNLTGAIQFGLRETDTVARLGGDALELRGEDLFRASRKRKLAIKALLKKDDIDGVITLGAVIEGDTEQLRQLPDHDDQCGSGEVARQDRLSIFEPQPCDHIRCLNRAPD